jgi:hypothetical protein
MSNTITLNKNLFWAQHIIIWDLTYSIIEWEPKKNLYVCLCTKLNEQQHNNNKNYSQYDIMWTFWIIFFFDFLYNKNLFKIQITSLYSSHIIKAHYRCFVVVVVINAIKINIICSAFLIYYYYCVLLHWTYNI